METCGTVDRGVLVMVAERAGEKEDWQWAAPIGPTVAPLRCKAKEIIEREHNNLTRSFTLEPTLPPILLPKF